MGWANHAPKPLLHHGRLKGVHLSTDQGVNRAGLVELDIFTHQLGWELLPVAEERSTLAHRDIRSVRVS